jgi:hypothetical protein
VEISHKGAQDDGLLNVFLAEISPLRLNDIEEFGADCCYASKKMWSCETFELAFSNIPVIRVPARTTPILRQRHLFDS